MTEITKCEITLALIIQAKTAFITRPKEVWGMCQAFISTMQENQAIRNSVSNVIATKLGLSKLGEFKKAGAGFDTNAWIRYLIPEFNFTCLGGDMSQLDPSEADTIMDYPETVDGIYWWPKENRQVRVEAFEYLISLYRAKISRLLDL